MFALPKLPYETTALAPFLTSETFEFHYGKHHKTYVDNLNNLLESSPLKGQSLEDIVKKSEGGIFNNSAQCWIHTFYWYSLTPAPKPLDPSSSLQKAIEKDFGSVAGLKEKFIEKAKGLFGSGWTWLVKNAEGNLELINTSNAEVPFKSKSCVPLFVCDVWEHAYYIDYRNARPKYLESFWAHIDWSFAAKNEAAGAIPDMGRLMKA